MSKLTSGILGPLKGKIGGVVGSTWKGIPVLKTKPASVANPRTAAQVTQRNAFTEAVAFARVILVTIIKPLWDRFAQGQSGFNRFISVNIGNWDGSAFETPENIEISRGILAKADTFTASADTGATQIDLNYSDDTGEGDALSTDEIYVVVFNETTGFIQGFSSVATRDVPAPHVIIDDALEVDDVVHVYLAFKRADNTKVSNTNYSTFTFEGP